MIHVRFLRPRRQYNVGDVASFSDADAETLVRGGHAERVTREPVEEDKMVKPPKDDKRPKKGLGVVVK